MHESKLIGMFRRLSGRQLARLEDFLHSPFFNKNDDIKLFFNYLKKYAPDFDHQNLNREIVLKKLKTQKPPDEKRLATLMSQLSGLTEQFLNLEINKPDNFPNHLSLADYYHEAGLSKHYNAVINRAEKYLDEAPFQDASFLFERYQLERLKYRHTDPNLRAFNAQLQSAADALDAFYVVEKLRYTCEMLNYERTLNIAYEQHFAPEILAALESKKLAALPAVHLYLKLLKMLSDLENTDLFFELKTLLRTYETAFPVAELKHLYDVLLNFCTWRVNRFHDQIFEKEFFQLNAFLLEKGLLFENGVLSPWRYSNLVTVALRLGEAGWTQDFIYRFREKLPPQHADNLFQYKLGQVYYHTGKLREAQAALNRVDLKDTFVSLSVRSLLVRIYYELGETELLLSFLEAFRVYLLRDQLTRPPVKDQFRNFIDFTRKLARIAPFETEKLAALRQNLPPADATHQFGWLMEMLNKK